MTSLWLCGAAVLRVRVISIDAVLRIGPGVLPGGLHSSLYRRRIATPVKLLHFNAL
jgi:hypothetical protein